MSATLCLRLAAMSGLLVVALGAFGAHGLKSILSEYQTQEIWQKAVLYHMFHTLVVLLLANRPTPPKGAVIFFLLGICLFSGSLYILAASNIRWLGAITPIGGVSFLVGWILVFIYP
jgi:uncharacterized membrane protein YgdD (TMEM256/DUF423 family)